MRTLFVCSRPCLSPLSIFRNADAIGTCGKSSIKRVLWLTLHRRETAWVSGFGSSLYDFRMIFQIQPIGVILMVCVVFGCLWDGVSSAHWRVLHAVNRVDVRMRILGSFSTAHWLNPPYTAVPGKNLHFGFQEVTVPWNPGFRVSGSRLSLCLSLKLFVLL